MKQGMLDQLAVNGGVPVRRTPLPPWPVFSDEMIGAASKVLSSGRVNYWTGDECRRFESEFASYHSVKHGIAIANGTLALELALRVLEVGPGDEVVVTPRSYFASASCIMTCGAIPVFADVDAESQNITAKTIAERITAKTKAILVVHLAGWPCDMDAIMALAHARGLYVIEDCAQAHGAHYGGKLVGTFGDVAAFSFCQDKIMSTAGEGGMLITDSDRLWKSAWAYKDHGKSYDRVMTAGEAPGFRWLHDSFGSNWRLTELQAAIGLIQLHTLDQWVRSRRHNAKRLFERLSQFPALRVPWPTENEGHSFYKFYAFLKREYLNAGWTRGRILSALEAEGIPGLSGSCPEIYRERAFADRSYQRLPVARELGESSLMFFVHPTLADADIDDMAEAVGKVLAVATE